MRAILTLILLNCLFLVPTWLRFAEVGPHHLALEAVLVVALFLLLPRGRGAAVLAGLAALLAGAVSILAFADTAARRSLARPLNLYLDVQLAPSVLHLLQGALGPIRGAALLAGSAALAVGSAVGLGFLLYSVSTTRPGLRPRLPAAALLTAAVVAIPARWAHPAGVSLALPATLLVTEQEAQLRRMLGERSRFALEMEASPARYAGSPALLSGLERRDVIVAFIESYGTTVLDTPEYAGVVRPKLATMDSALHAAGLHVVTGTLVAPSQGGMSWLGHGSLLSGLWLDNQLRYDLLLASDRHTLVDDFEAAGYRSAALMPAITMAWPEGARFGYDDIRTFDDIDYAGPPLNWVTMPDQFTWSYLQHAIREESDEPLFAELGLISSHAPWTPILEVLEDWEHIGDGAVFRRWEGAGESPEELWRDGERVRAHYALSVGYAIDAMAGWAARYLGDEALLLALGDHQPAPLITGDDAPRTVPVHVVAADSSLLEPFLGWGFRRGVLPPENVRPRRMSEFRPWFVRTFSRPVRVTSGPGSGVEEAP
jgi:hypothetical protein